MKAALKLFLVFILLQILGSLAAVPLVLVYQFVVTGTLEADAVGTQTLVPGSLLTLFFTVWYLWKNNYLTDDGQLYAPVSGAYLGWTALMGIGAVLLLSALTGWLDFLPDWLETSFDHILSSWAGVCYVALLGPVLEELLFRGAITRELLRKFRPGMAIFISGLLFGLIHFNPVQTVFGFLAGMLLAWLYWRTRSVIPCVVVHVLNNSLSVYAMLAYPDVESLDEIFGPSAESICLAVAAVAFALGLWRLSRYPKAPDYDRTYVEPLNTDEQ